MRVIEADVAADPRFRTEVAAARRVNGAFTTPVVAADLDADVPWLATAYVAGPTLAEAVRDRGPVPAASLLLLATGLASGLLAIHDAGLVHRDLNPSNVLLDEDGPRVTGFGLARRVLALGSRRPGSAGRRRVLGARWVLGAGAGFGPGCGTGERHLQPGCGGGVRGWRTRAVRGRVECLAHVPAGQQRA